MVHVTKVSWKELMARFTQNWYVSIVQGKNNANSTGAIFSKVPVMPWIHHRLHPVLVRIFLRLGLSKTLKEEIQVTGRQMTRCGKRNCRTVSFFEPIARAVTPLVARTTWSTRSPGENTLSSFSVLERPNLKKILTSTG